MLEYKGYFGSVEYNDDDEIFHGRLEFIRDLVAYEGDDAKSLKRAFQEAVDDYLELCATEGRKPDVPLKGSFKFPPIHFSRKY
jgi:predicted HicB family RNase H-like nuclease